MPCFWVSKRFQFLCVGAPDRVRGRALARPRSRTRDAHHHVPLPPALALLTASPPAGRISLDRPPSMLSGTLVARPAGEAPARLATPLNTYLEAADKLYPAEVDVQTGGPATRRLHVRGPNIMAGYLKADAPGLLQPPADGWQGEAGRRAPDPPQRAPRTPSQASAAALVESATVGLRTTATSAAGDAKDGDTTSHTQNHMHKRHVIIQPLPLQRSIMDEAHDWNTE